eukprot:Opistho-1_new@24980
MEGLARQRAGADSPADDVRKPPASHSPLFVATAPSVRQPSSSSQNNGGLDRRGPREVSLTDADVFGQALSPLNPCEDDATVSPTRERRCSFTHSLALYGDNGDACATQVWAMLDSEQATTPRAVTFGPAEFSDADVLECLDSVLRDGMPDDSSPWAIDALSGRLTDAPAFLAAFGAKVQRNVRDRNGETELHLALRLGCRRGVIRLLLGLGADPAVADARSQNAFHKAALYGHVDALDELLAVGGDTKSLALGAADECGETPLHIAARLGHGHVVGRLLECGAQVAARDSEGDSALHAAAVGGLWDIVAAVARKMGDPNPTNRMRMTPLHHAAVRGMWAAVLCLVLDGNSAAIDAEALGLVPPSSLSRVPCGSADPESPKRVCIVPPVRAKATLSASMLSSTAGCRRSEACGRPLATATALDVATAHSQEPCVEDSQTTDEAARMGAICEAVRASRSADALNRRLFLNARDGERRTPLHYACYAGRQDTAMLLVAAGADARAFDIEGWTSLHYACVSGKASLASFLCASGADVRATDGEGNAPLSYAAYLGRVGVCKVLLDAGAAPNLRNRDGETPMHKAAFRGDVECGRLLLAAGGEADAQSTSGLTPLHLASRNGNREFVELLLTEGRADPNRRNSEGASPVHMASMGGHAGILRLLLEHGGAPDACDNDRRFRPVHLAAYAGSNECIEVLRERGVSISPVDTEGITPLHFACIGGHVETVRLLVQLGGDIAYVDGKGRGCLGYAANNGRAELVRLMLSRSGPLDCLASARPIDVNAVDGMGDTALHLAVTDGHADVVSVLLDYGANINATNAGSETALVCAARLGREECVRVLLERGAPWDTLDKMGRLPLHWAVAGGHLGCATLLLKPCERQQDASEAVANAAECEQLAEAAVAPVDVPDARVVEVEVAVEIPRSVDATSPVPQRPMANVHLLPHLHDDALNNGDANRNDDGLSGGALGAAAVDSDDAMSHSESDASEIEDHAEMDDAPGAPGDALNRGDDNGATPLHIAACTGHYACVKLLLDSGADARATDNEASFPAHKAAYNGHLDCLRLLLSSFPEHLNVLDGEMSTPLHKAVYNGHADCAQYLLDRGCVVDPVDGSGWTPLHMAAHRGKSSCVALLLARGASVASLVPTGRHGPLHLAVRAGQLECIRQLVSSNRAYVDLQDGDGRTALHHAVMRGNADYAEVLLAAGANPDVFDNNGCGALLHGMHSNNMAIVRRLIDSGASLLPGEPRRRGSLAAAVPAANAHHGDGERSLRSLVRDASEEVLSLLVEMGVDVDRLRKQKRQCLGR